jgi:hypothetical protein
MVKPLDLNVAIQNTYQAARSEAARLDMPQVLNHLQNEDSAKQQVARDHRVSAAENTMLHQDLFAEDAYDPPDYDLMNPREKKKDREQKKQKATDDEKAAIESTIEPEAEAHDGGFSTYA